MSSLLYPMPTSTTAGKRLSVSSLSASPGVAMCDARSVLLRAPPSSPTIEWGRILFAYEVATSYEHG
jgi:hypothetical protein